MKHIEKIQAFITMLMNSESFHALVIESAPGWGKSTTIDLVLHRLGIKAIAAGSYATSLHIYNTLVRNPDSLIILDDCAGLFSDPKSMAILKAATWQSSGNEPLMEPSIPKPRRVAWGTTSDKAEQPFVDFSGKLILLTNTVPTGKETEAFISRCIRYEITIEEGDVTDMLLTAATSQTHFSNSELALEVARFLIAQSTHVDLKKMNLRYLKLGYETATMHPEEWRKLLLDLLPRNKKAPNSLSQILSSDLPVKEQEAKFQNATGKSRRTYYNYKKKLGLSRSYERAR